MNQDDKSKYMREWYNRNADRLRAAQRARYRAKKEGLVKPYSEDADSCTYCKRFSAPRMKSDTGWCMKHRRQKNRKDICSDFLPKVKIRYEQTVHAVTVFTGE
jgi:hypothetical protein